MPALDPALLVRSKALPEHYEAVRDRLGSDGAVFWFDFWRPHARHLSILDLDAFVQLCNAAGEREAWEKDVIEARKAGKPIVSQYTGKDRSGTVVQALGNGALARRYAELSEKLRAELGFSPAAAAKIREARQADMFAEMADEGPAAAMSDEELHAAIASEAGKVVEFLRGSSTHAGR